MSAAFGFIALSAYFAVLQYFGVSYNAWLTALLFGAGYCAPDFLKWARR